MASFVVHNIAGEKFLQLLEESGINLSPEQKDKFLLGNLIVDSSKIKKVIPTKMFLKYKRWKGF